MSTTDALSPSGRPPPPPRLPSAGPGFWWRVLSPPLAVIGSFVIAGVVFAVLASLDLSDDASGAIATSVAGIGLLALGAALLARLPAAQRRLTLAWRHGAGSGIGLGVAAGFGALVIAVPIFAIAEAVDPSTGDRLEDLQDDLAFGANWQLGLLVFALVVLAPFGEELVFRGLLLRGLVRRMPFWTAAILSGLVFASAHFDVYQVWPRALFLATIGIGFAFLYRWRGYGASVTAHMTVNTAAAIGLVAG